MSVFYLDSSPYMLGKYVVRVHHDKFNCRGTVGSYAVLGARLFGISFANYLRLCRDEYGAEIYGKGTAYPVAYFDDNEKARALIEKLNELATIVLREREE